MKSKIVMMMLFMVQGLCGAILEIENRTRFTCEVQPVVDNTSRSTMGSFKYYIRSGMSEKYNSGFYPIKALRWRITIYLDNNTKLARHYYLAEMPGDVGFTNINAKVILLPNGDFQYYKNKNNLAQYVEFTPLQLKYTYQYTKSGWKPFQGVVKNRSFDFNAEMANDIYR